MRILYLDFFLLSLNPSNSMMAMLIKKLGPTTFYGPSYVSDLILKDGIIEFIKKNGPFDFFIMGPNLPIFLEKEDFDNHLLYLKNYTALTKNTVTLKFFIEDVISNISNINIKYKICSMFLIDMYALVEKQFERIIKNNFYVFAPDKNFVPTTSELPKWAFKEDHFVRKKNKISNAWLSFLTNYEERVISCFHYVLDNELSLNSIDSRINDVTIPGVNYLKRTEAKKLISKSNIKLTKSYLPIFYKLANFLKIPVFSNYFLLKFYNLFFQYNLFNTKFIYTARGGFGIAIRKFFEIPISGAVLICLPPHGFCHLGFVNKKHFLFSEPCDLIKNIQYLKENIGVAQTIANNGRELVYNMHSLDARSQQILKCLEAIKKNKFLGSKWQNGKYIVKTVN